MCSTPAATRRIDRGGVLPAAIGDRVCADEQQPAHAAKRIPKTLRPVEISEARVGSRNGFHRDRWSSSREHEVARIMPALDDRLRRHTAEMTRGSADPDHGEATVPSRPAAAAGPH